LLLDQSLLATVLDVRSGTHHVINPSKSFSPLFILQATKAGHGGLGMRLGIVDTSIHQVAIFLLFCSKFMRTECLNSRFVFDTPLPISRLVAAVGDSILQVVVFCRSVQLSKSQ